jgi:hypothetical protein
MLWIFKQRDYDNVTRKLVDVQNRITQSTDQKELEKLKVEKQTLLDRLKTLAKS